MLRRSFERLCVSMRGIAGGVQCAAARAPTNLACESRLHDPGGLRPISTSPGFVRDHRLAFNLPGFSLAEPAFASIAPAVGEECHGGVFELSLADWARLCATEGVPFGYRVVEVDVELYGGGCVSAWTLEGGVATPFGDLSPSARYLDLLREGARELGLTRQWQERLAAVPAAPLGSRPALRSESFERRPQSTFV